MIDPAFEHLLGTVLLFEEKKCRFDFIVLFGEMEYELRIGPDTFLQSISFGHHPPLSKTHFRTLLSMFYHINASCNDDLFLQLLWGWQLILATITTITFRTFDAQLLFREGGEAPTLPALTLRCSLPSPARRSLSQRSPFGPSSRQAFYSLYPPDRLPVFLSGDEVGYRNLFDDTC